MENPDVDHSKYTPTFGFMNTETFVNILFRASTERDKNERIKMSGKEKQRVWDKKTL